MKEELKKTFENGDQRTELLHKKLKELDLKILEKDTILQNKEKISMKIMQKYKKIKKENKELKGNLGGLKEKIENSDRFNEQLQVENGQFKDNQLDFQSILNEKIEQITKELKGEREKRAAEQNYSRVFFHFFFLFEIFFFFFLKFFLAFFQVFFFDFFFEFFFQVFFLWIFFSVFLLAFFSSFFSLIFFLI